MTTDFPHDPDCVFCKIVSHVAPASIVREWPDATVIVPIGPVVRGHVLVIPHRHVETAVTEPRVTAAAMRRAAEYAKPLGACNIIMNVEKDAGQTVFHLHIHVVPRRPGDGLVMPWDAR